MLTEAEETLNSCKEDCGKVVRSVYNTVPSGLYKAHADGLECASIVKSHSNLPSLLATARETKLIAYPNKRFYRSEPLIMEKVTEEVDPLISFTPSFLDYGLRYFTHITNSPVGQLAEEMVTVKTSPRSRDVSITSVEIDVQLLEVVFISTSSRFVRSGNSLKLKVKYFPLTYGNNTAYLFFKLSNGKTYIYKATAYGVENEFNLKPIFASGYSLNSAEVVPVIMRNPYEDRSIELYCIKNSGSMVKVLYNTRNGMCHGSQPFFSIPPLTELNPFNVSISIQTSGSIVATLAIKTNLGSVLVLPVIATASAEANISPSTLDFGTVSPSDLPHRILVRVDTSLQALRITKIVYSKGPEFFLYFPIMSQEYPIVPRNSKPSLLGYVAFHSAVPGSYEGRVLVYTNYTRVTRLDLKALVVSAPLLYESSKVFIDIAGKSFDKHYYKTITVWNNMRDLLVFTRAEIGLTNVSAYLVNNSGGKSALETLKPREKADLLQVKYWRDKSWSLPMNCFVSVLASESVFYIPVAFYESNVTCQYADGHTLVREKCSEMAEMNLGIFSERAKTTDLLITNNDPTPITLSNLSLHSAFCCFQLLDANSAIVENSNRSLRILPSQSVKIRFHLSLTECGGNAEKARDGETFTEWFTLGVDGAELRIKLAFSFRPGELSFSPALMNFEPGFTGMVLAKKLKVVSTFKVPLRILNSWASDSRISLVLSKSQISPESSTEIGAVVFAPGSSPEERHFVERRRQTLLWDTHTITLAEYRLWREKKAGWESYSSLSVNTQVCVDTDVVQSVKLPVRANLAEFAVVKEGVVDFGAVANSSAKELFMTLCNPTAVPLAVQLLPSDLAYADHKANPILKFSDQKNPCVKTYEQWMISYNITLEQLINKEPVTLYESFEDFAEDYCSCAGKFSPSLLLTSAPKDSEAAKMLETYCNAKAIVAIPSKEDKTLLNLLLNLFKRRKERSTMISVNEFEFPRKYTEEVTIIKPMTNLSIGPFIYTPMSVGKHSGMIFVKNNLTVLHPVVLKGESDVGVLKVVGDRNLALQKSRELKVISREHFKAEQGVDTEIECKLALRDLFTHDSNSQSLGYRLRRVHSRVFTLKNIGNMPLTITSININSRKCKALGLQIENCSSFTIHPNSEHKLKLSYYINTVFVHSRYEITFETQSGKQSFGLAIKIQKEAFRLQQRAALIEKPVRIFEVCSQLGLTMTILSMSLFVLLITTVDLANAGNVYTRQRLFKSRGKCSGKDREEHIKSLKKALSGVAKNKEHIFSHIKKSQMLKEANKERKHGNELARENGKPSHNERAHGDKEADNRVEEVNATTAQGGLKQGNNDRKESSAGAESAETKEAVNYEKKEINEVSERPKQKAKSRKSRIKSRQNGKSASKHLGKNPSPEKPDSHISDAVPTKEANSEDVDSDIKDEARAHAHKERQEEFSGAQNNESRNSVSTNNEAEEGKVEDSNTSNEEERHVAQVQSGKGHEWYVRKNWNRPENAQEEVRPYYYQQRKYLNSAYGRYYKKPMVRYVYKQPQTRYQKKVKPLPANDNEKQPFTGDMSTMQGREIKTAIKEVNDRAEDISTFYEEKRKRPVNSPAEKPLVNEEKGNSAAKKSSSVLKRERVRGLGGILLEPHEESKADKGPSSSFHADDSNGEEKESSEISLLEAFNFANSLLGYKTLISEQKPMSNFSPLSELRGDSVEYKPGFD